MLFSFQLSAVYMKQTQKIHWLVESTADSTHVDLYINGLWLEMVDLSFFSSCVFEGGGRVRDLASQTKKMQKRLCSVKERKSIDKFLPYDFLYPSIIIAFLYLYLFSL